MRNIRRYVKDIHVAMTAVCEFIIDMDFETFRHDGKTTTAVVKKLELIGEAAKHIPDSIREKYTQVPWRQMTGMRDRLTHAYYDIDYRIVWNTVKDIIPSLQPIIAQILEELEKEQTNE